MNSLFRFALLVLFVGTIGAKNIYFDAELDSQNDGYLTNVNNINTFLEDKDIKINERRVRHVEPATESMLQHFQKILKRKVVPSRRRKNNHKKNQATTPAPHKNHKQSTNKRKKDKQKKQRKGKKNSHKTTTRKNITKMEDSERE